MRGAIAAVFAAPLLISAVGLPAHAEDATAEGPGRVSGVVFFDQNNDKVRQPEEPGAAGFEVWISEAGGDFSQRTTTDANGAYQLTDIPVGKHSLQLERAGHETTTPYATAVVIYPDSDEWTVDFGIK